VSLPILEMVEPSPVDLGVFRPFPWAKVIKEKKKRRGFEQKSSSIFSH
jgi:hypothetical protein